MHHQLAAFGDLTELILGVAVNVDLEAVHSRAQIVARVVVAVDHQAVGQRAEAGGALVDAVGAKFHALAALDAGRRTEDARS